MPPNSLGSLNNLLSAGNTEDTNILMDYKIIEIFNFFVACYAKIYFKMPPLFTHVSFNELLFHLFYTCIHTHILMFNKENFKYLTCSLTYLAPQTN